MAPPATAAEVALPATTTTQQSEDDNHKMGLVGLLGLIGLLKRTKKGHIDCGYNTGAGDPNRPGP